MTPDNKHDIWHKFEKQGNQVLHTLCTRDASTAKAMLIVPELIDMLHTISIWAKTTKHPLNVMDHRMFENVDFLIIKATGKE